MDIEQEIKRIEGEDIGAIEETDDFFSHRARLVLEASKTPFWNEVLMPELDNYIATLDSSMTTEEDPWRRYANVEAYRIMCIFKINLIDVLERAQQSEE